MLKAKVENRPGCYIDKIPRPKNKRPCAYCWSNVHRGYLNAKLIKKHKCLQKQCECLQKFDNHEYWILRDKTKQLRKERKKILYGK